jgi:hypothetical protein
LLTSGHIGQLLRGIPQAFVDEIDINDVWRKNPTLPDWYHRMGAGIRRDRALMRRKAIIDQIAGWEGWSDHGRAWSVGGRIVAIEGRPYHLEPEFLTEVAWIARTWNLTLEIDFNSWYAGGRATRIVLSAKLANQTGGAK